MKTYLKAIRRVVISVGVLYLVWSCANIVPPNGGPKDVIAPRAVRSEPENRTARFKNKQIKIVFDEYIQLKNLNTELMISPPMNEPPYVTVRSKSLIVKIEDTLKPHTTYNMYFGNAIADITESNSLSNFSYVFSTGEFVDSMRVKGYVYEAFDLKPAEDIYVLLYDSVSDSVPYTQRPLYITKTDKNGYFEFNNLRDTTYKIFALKDANMNLLFDLPYEKIAFIDSLIHPDLPEVKIKDLSDTLTKKDTLEKGLDTIVEKVTMPKPKTYYMHLFEQVDSTQKVLKKALVRKGLVTVLFKYPVRDFSVKYIAPGVKKEDVTEEFNALNDTLKLWIKDTLADSLLAVIYQHDTVLDTLQMGIKPKASKRASYAKLLGTFSFPAGALTDYFMKPVVEFNSPVAHINSEAVTLLEDTIAIKPLFSFSDSAHRFLQLDNELKEGSAYELLIPQQTVKDIFGYVNDTLRLKFKARKKEDYGTLTLNVKLMFENRHYLIQLLNEKGAVVYSHHIHSSRKILMERMLPEKFTVKVISDTNADGKWNTGSYKDKRQPEKVQFIKGEINTRANWDVETEINIEE